MNKNAKKFEEWHWKIYENYLNATIHLRIWWLIHNEKYVRFANRNKEFFSFDAYAHLTAGVLGITRIFDRDKRSINFEKFLEFSLKNKEDIEKVFPNCKFCNHEKSQQISKEVNELRGSLEEIRTWRDKLFAHVERDFKSKPIRWGHFKNIIDFLERHILDYGSKPNHSFTKAKDFEDSIRIEKFFEKYFKN
ncbi:MAG: hypothetical protein ACK4WF_06690 [Candidatus Brocadiales bacterium]